MDPQVSCLDFFKRRLKHVHNGMTVSSGRCEHGYFAFKVAFFAFNIWENCL